MPRGSKRVSCACDNHQFSLKPLGEYIIHGQHLNVSFCSNYREKTLKKGLNDKNKSCLGCPIFNADRNDATPTFILTSQKNYYKEKGEKMREEQKRKMVSYSDEKTSLNIPKPRSKNNYCSACRQHYQDYLQHIEGPQHKRKINQNLFNRYIIELTEKYNKHPIRNTSQRTFKRTQQKTRPSSSHLQNSNQVEIISNPVKRVKPNETLPQNDMQFNFNNQFRSPNFGDMRLSSSHYSYFKPFSSTYQDQINFNVYTLNYNLNMNLYMNQNPFMMSSLNPNYQPIDMAYQPSMQFMGYPCQHSQPFFQNNCMSRPKPTCIIIDE